MAGPGSRGSGDRRPLLLTSAYALVALALLAAGAVAYRDSRIDSERRDLTIRLTPYTTALGNVVSARVGMLTGLQQFVTVTLPSGPTTESFRPFAAGLYSGAPGIRAIQVARGDVIEYMHPVTGNEAAVGLSLLTDPRPAVRADVRRTMGTTGVTVGGPYALAQGGKGVILRQAIRYQGGYWGLAAVVIDLPTMLRQAGIDHAPSGLRYAIRDGRGTTFAGDGSIFAGSPVIQDVQLPEGSWQVAAVPSAGWDAAAAPAVESFLVVGIVIVGLTATGVHTGLSRARELAEEVQSRTHELQASNELLTADILRREEAEAALETSEQRFRTLFEASPVGLWEEDFSQVKREVDALAATVGGSLKSHLDEHPDETRRLLGLARVIAVNDATVKLHGLENAQVALDGFTPFIAPESIDLMRDELLAVAEGRQSFTADMLSLTASGQEMYLSVTLTVVPGFEGSWERVIVAAMDLTERKRAEDELADYSDQLEALVRERTAELTAANEELRAATRAKDDFFAAMSHELRTPLNSILGFTGVVLSGMAGEINEEQRHQLSMVRRSGRHLLNLVNDLLDLTRLEATGMPPEASEFDLGEVLEVVGGMVRPLADEKHIRVVATPPKAPVAMNTDRGHLEQILLNLTGNAVKFADGGVVAMTASLEGASVVIAVSDEGPGIPESEQEAVFDEFHQLPRPDSAKPQGTGLGLAISRRLARGLGGDITLRSDGGHGTTFTVTVPVVLPVGPPRDEARGAV